MRNHEAALSGAYYVVRFLRCGEWHERAFSNEFHAAAFARGCPGSSVRTRNGEVIEAGQDVLDYVARCILARWAGEARWREMAKNN